MSDGSQVGAVLGYVVCLLAGLLLAAGCAESTSDVTRADLNKPGTRISVAVPGVSVALPPITGKERPVRRAGAPAEPLPVGGGGNQTLLVHCSTEQIEPSVMHEAWHRVHVIVLDGPPAPGTYEITPDNGRFLEFTALRPARQPYTGLEGTVEILSVSDGTVLADCSVRNVIKVSGEPVHALRGRYRFRITSGEMLSPDTCGLQVAPGAGAMPAPEAERK